MIYKNQFFLSIFNQLRKLCLNSNFYDKKISKIQNKNLIYKPSPHLLSSLIKYQKKKYKIEDYFLDEIWGNNQYKNLNNFYWFFSLDLKSSKKEVQSVISNWIKRNDSYNDKCWSYDLIAKRIISWLSNHNLSYDGSDQDYKSDFNKIILKQTNHLINEVSKSKTLDDKLICCASIILVGLCYQEEKNISLLEYLF